MFLINVSARFQCNTDDECSKTYSSRRIFQTEFENNDYSLLNDLTSYIAVLVAFWGKKYSDLNF